MFKVLIEFFEHNSYMDCCVSDPLGENPAENDPAGHEHSVREGAEKVEGAPIQLMLHLTS